MNNFIDAFCGAGGMSLGLIDAGFEISSALDLDAMAVLTHEMNLPGMVFECDVRYVSGKALLRRSGLSDGELTLLCGGPPCQGFSMQRKDGHQDSRNSLVSEFSRLVKEMKPRFFLFENVRAIKGIRGDRFISPMTDELKSEGYNISPFIYEMQRYGIPQSRSRFVIVGELGGETFRHPLPNDEIKTVRDAIGDLPDPPEDGSEHPDFPNHIGSNLSKKNIERFSHVPPGGGWMDIPVDLMLPCHRRMLESGAKGGMWPDVYGRLEWDLPAPTITTGFDSFTRGRYGHPSKDRALTPREAARIQGFPDWFRFRGNREDVRKQIGNAVPPPLAEAIGRAILEGIR